MRSIIVLSIGFLAAASAGSVYSKYRNASSKGNDEPDGELWALLVAGSNGWYNYRHQADVAHAFHVLKSHGVPESNIVTMMYDDIANDPHQPEEYRGKLFNSPNMIDYYEGLKIDYRGEDVTVHNFLNVLKGNSSGVRGGNGRVIESKANDRVFVYFTDHGGVGTICFPHEDLTTKQLIDALKWSHENNRFSDLVFYLESCESGSMFERVLPDNINVYAVTAANGRESSMGAYCGYFGGIDNCLGDEFSVRWMEDSDVEDLTTETIGTQFDIVKKATTKSHVSRFGKMETENDPVSWFQGSKKAMNNGRNAQRTSYIQSADTTIPSRDVEITFLERTLLRTNDEEEAKIIRNRIEEIKMKRFRAGITMSDLARKMYDTKISRIESNMRPALYVEKNEESSIVHYPECHHKIVHIFRRLCVTREVEMEYFLPHFYVLNNMCNAELGRSIDIMEAIVDQCLNKQKE